ncbi:MAG: DUF4350 domain-containing protein [Candidatus Thorarchaeota archaeon]
MGSLLFLTTASTPGPVAGPLYQAVTTDSATKPGVSPLSPAELPTRTLRVAIYYEPNATVPDYGAIGQFYTNFSSLKDVLEDANYEVTNVSQSDILNHQLTTAAYDVLVIPDVLPRENITNMILEYWLGGGGILSVDSGIIFLNYFGIVPTGSAGTSGYGATWDYVWTGQQIIDSIAPPTRKYNINDSLEQNQGYDYAAFDWSHLSSTPDGDYMVRLTRPNITSTTYATGVAYDPPNAGGKVVQLPGNVTSLDPDFENLLVDAVDWVAPRPKGRVAYDLSHQPRLAVDSWDTLSAYPEQYSKLRNLTVARDFTFDKLYPSGEGNLTAERLAPYDVLILVTPDYNYTQPEVNAIQDWVLQGGSLFVLGEPGNGVFAKTTEQLNGVVAPFGLEVNMTVAGSGDVNLLGEHIPLTEGYSSKGLYMQPFWGYVNITSPNAFGVWYDLGGIAIAAAEPGQGRVVLSADMNWLANNRIGVDKNERYSVNIFNWLTSTNADVLLYVDDPYPPNFYVSAVAQALNTLELSFHLTFTADGFNQSFHKYSYNLAVVDTPNYYSVTDAAADYVEAGGRLIMSHWAVNYVHNHHIWPMLGVVYGGETIDNPMVNIWDSNHPVFQTPFDFGVDSFTPNKVMYTDDGDTLHVLDNATALAGNSTLPTENKSLIVMRNDGKTLLNSFIIDALVGDSDLSGYQDSYELWTNEIAYFFKPLIDHPCDTTYELGSTGNTVTWTPISHAPSFFEVVHGSTTLTNGTWSGGPITVNIDGFGIGTFALDIEVRDLYGQTATDTVLVTVEDTTKPLLSSPDDLSYVEGTVGHWINWSASDLDPASYSVTRNGTPVTSGTWDGSDIDVNVDALAVGTYIFAINVSDGSGNFATDSVTVTVTETPTTTSTGTTSTSTTGTTSGTTSSTTNGTTTTGASGIPQWAIIAAAAGAVVVVVIIIVMMKRK